MNFATDLAQFVTSAYPDRTITDPSKKTPQWIRQHAAADLAHLHGMRGKWHLWMFDESIAENISYALGTQNTQQYRRFLSGSKGLDANSIEVTNRDGHFEREGDADSYVGRERGTSGAIDPMGLDSILNAEPLPILPVKLQGLKSLIMQQGYEPTITALGRKAEQEAREHEAEVRLWMDLGPDLQQQGMAPSQGMPDPMPTTEPELQTYLDDWQVEAAAALERKVQICGIESDVEQLMEEVADDFLRHGYGGLVDSQLPGRRPLSKRVMPSHGIFGPSAYPDFRDMSCGGYWEEIKFDQLKAEILDDKQTCNGDGKTWTKDDWAVLQRLATASAKGMNSDGQTDVANTGAFYVVRWYFLSNDSRKWKTKTDDAGNVRTWPKRSDYKMSGKGKLLELPLNCLYEATLVCGTNLAYNCRKVHDQGRDLHNPLKARMPFALFSAGHTNGYPVSIVKNVKNVVDEAERSWRGYMADKRTYMPEGFNITMKALTAMAQAMKVKGENPEMEVYKFIKQTGDSFGDFWSDELNQQIGAPVTKNPGGLPASAGQHLADLFQQMQLLEMLTGANAVVSAATPASESGKGVNEIALQGAANIMASYRKGLKKVYENNARNLAGRIWLTEKDVPITGSVPGRGGRMQPVGPRKDLHEYGFFMKVELAPSEKEWEALYGKAAQASANGQITVADEMKIMWLSNLKTAQRYLAMAVSRKARQDKEDRMAEMKANADSQTQTGVAVAQAQTESNTQNNKERMDLAVFQRETAWGGIERQTMAQEKIARLNVDGKVQVASIAEEGSALREHLTDTRTHEHEGNMAVLNSALAPEPAAP